MNDQIWEHFQNSESAEFTFREALPRYRFLIRQTKNKNSKVLNIGAGVGGLEKELLASGFKETYSLDPSHKTVEFLQKSLNLGSNIKQGYSQNIPFEDGFFDTVIMSEVLEHLNDQVLAGTLQEVKRVLKKDGIFIGTVPLNEILEANMAVCPKCNEVFHRWGHQQSFTIERIKGLFVDAGFAIKTIEARAFVDWSKTGIKSLIKNTIRYLLGRFGSPIAQANIFFVISKNGKTDE